MARRTATVTLIKPSALGKSEAQVLLDHLRTSEAARPIVQARPGTVTGRFSSSTPDFQSNAPRTAEGDAIRAAFRAAGVKKDTR